ncbi:MAG TPA: L-aspartate oxidase [Bacteroides sp.]|mgnify:CR=1 FL=1|nr:L-aspartate oxidase [Bacteroides sp.]
MEKVYDFLVIGTGLGGLSFALKVAEKGRVCLITKTQLEETNTRYAQGGIAAVTYEPDSYEKHVNDTLVAGDGLCDEEVVRMVVREAPSQIRRLVKWGTSFDRESGGKFELAREGGHSEHRILHHKDNTGEEIQHTLSGRVREHPNIDLLERHFAVDLITQHHLGKLVKRYLTDIECYGAYVLDLDSEKVIKILSRTTLLATGGAGQLYATTTNPVIATGDGVAMVYRAKGIVDHMEFIQFHPTSLYNPGESPSYLITEAMRGYGGILKNQKGEAFMKKYDERGSLAPRDIVARAIDNEMKTHGEEFVYLDVTHKEEKALKKHFPNITKKCQSLGIDIARDMIPVVPAAHYQCGGIRVDRDGATWIRRLYAVGEVSSTGLHGANRLASNSLIEAIVFADRAARHAIRSFVAYPIVERIPDWDESGTTHLEELVLVTQNLKELQQIMTNYVGIVRSDLRLERAAARLEIIFRETEELYKKSRVSKRICELRNLINVGYLVIKMAQARRESRGLHYNMDYPRRELAE